MKIFKVFPRQRWYSFDHLAFRIKNKVFAFNDDLLEVFSFSRLAVAKLEAKSVIFKTILSLKRSFLLGLIDSEMLVTVLGSSFL